MNFQVSDERSGNYGEQRCDDVRGDESVVFAKSLVQANVTGTCCRPSLRRCNLGLLLHVN